MFGDSFHLLGGSNRVREFGKRNGRTKSRRRAGQNAGRRRLDLEPLEPRIVLDGSKFAMLFEGGMPPGLTAEQFEPVGSNLAELYGEYFKYQNETPPAERDTQKFSPTNPDLKIVDDKVVFEAVAKGDPQILVQQLESLDVEVSAVFGSLISGLLPLDAIDELGGLTELNFARPVLSTARIGLTTSQGDVALGADTARATLSLDGTGIVVGTLSDSYNDLGGAAADINSGDLPAASDITILDDGNPGLDTDEGRGMMQIIRDVAPGARQSFHTAFRGQASFALGIEELAGCPPGSAAGCVPSPDPADIIVDDVGYFDEPFFQDGPIARAVDTVVNAGVAYFSAAGNSADQSYESPYRPTGQIGVFGELHNFNQGGINDPYQSITVPVNSGLIFSFQWDEPFASACLGCPGSASDIDIFVMGDGAGMTVPLAGSVNFNVGGDPVEIFAFFNDGSIDVDGIAGADTQFNIAIERFSGPAPGLMKYIYFGAGPGVTINEYDTNSPTSWGHPNATGAAAIGAADYRDTPQFGTNPPQIESYSSEGGINILFSNAGGRLGAPQMRQTPDVVGPDGGNTTFFGADVDGDGFPNFFGTSAAAPHVAAVAALMLQGAGGRGSLSPAQIYSALETTAIDMDDPSTPGFDNGFDNRTGFGLVDALAAVDLVTPDLPAPEINVTGNNLTILDGDNTPSPADDTDFGPVELVGATAVHRFTIENNGTEVLNVSSISLSGAQVADFTLMNLNVPATLQPNGRITFDVEFDPSAVGRRTAMVNIVNDDSDENPYNFLIEGNGFIPAPEIDVQGGGLTIPDGDSSPRQADGTDFGDAAVNVQTVTHTFTILNIGTLDLNVTGLELQGAGASQFSLSGLSVPQTLIPGAQVTFSVSFSPTVLGVSTAMVVIDNDDPNESQYNFVVRGRGVPPMPEIDVTGNNLSIPDGDTTPQLPDGTDFGETEAFVGAVTHTFKVKNVGTLPLTISAITVTGPNAGDFIITAPPLPQNVAILGGTLTFDVTFTPTATGPRFATIRIDNNDANENPYTFDVQGVGALAIAGVPLDADTNTFRVFGTSSSALVGFAYGTELGTSMYTGFGQSIRLSIKNPEIFAGSAASDEGIAYAELDVPARLRGQTIYYQAFEILPSPIVSVVVPLLLPLNALAGEGAGAPPITNNDLAAVRSAAVERLAAASDDAHQARQKLASIDVVLQDLPDGRLGHLIGSTIFIDPTAAGHGWFVDSTPGDDSEFLSTAFDTELYAPGGSEAASRIDLLTVLMHELGHGLGWAHSAPGAAHSLMADGLLNGIRRLPAGGPVEVADFNQFVVNSTADASDADPGDGQCDVGGGNCTLRAAIEEANAMANLATPDVIAFDIAGAGPHTIQPALALPEIREPVIIDATTEPDYAGTPVVELDGSLAGRRASGLTIDETGSGTTIRGLAINHFFGSGILIDGADDNVIEANFIGTDVAGSTGHANGRSGVRIMYGDRNVVGGTGDAGNLISGNRQAGVHVVHGANNVIEGNLIGTDADGNGAVPNARGVLLQQTSDNQIGGEANVISGNLFDGVRIIGASSGNVLLRNLIGTNAAGDTALANLTGVVLASGASQNFVGGPDAGDGNVISGNLTSGVQILSSENVVRGNLIGTNAAGDAAIPNRFGVAVTRGTGTVIGGTTDAARNVISGNADVGVWLTGKLSSAHVVEGNYIGTDPTGTSAIANRRGIVVETSGNTIGGEADGAGNLVSGNRQIGVMVRGSRAVTNVVAGNAIGTDAAQTAALPNNMGVVVLGAADNTIGGAADGAGNVIAGNTKQGVKIVGFVSTGNLVQGNSIGVSADSSTPLPNQDGVRIASRASDNTIGGSAPGAANEIAHNTGRGVWIAGGTGNTVSENSIHDNGNLGIDLGRGGVTLNDPDDADRSANNLQNFPEISSAALSSGTLTIDFEVPSDPANSAYPIRVEFFAADADGEEGQTFLGSAAIAAPGVQQATIPAGAFVGGDLIVATATDADGNTSEFSEPAQVLVLFNAASNNASSAADLAELYDAGLGDSLLDDLLGQIESKPSLDAASADQAFAQL